MLADLVVHSLQEDGGNVAVVCRESPPLADLLDVRVLLAMLATIVRPVCTPFLVRCLTLSPMWKLLQCHSPPVPAIVWDSSTCDGMCTSPSLPSPSSAPQYPQMSIIHTFW